MERDALDRKLLEARAKDPVARLDDKLRAKRESFDKIPVIDIAPLLDGSNKRAFGMTPHTVRAPLMLKTAPAAGRSLERHC